MIKKIECLSKMSSLKLLVFLFNLQFLICSVSNLEYSDSQLITKEYLKKVIEASQINAKKMDQQQVLLQTLHDKLLTDPEIHVIDFDKQDSISPLREISTGNIKQEANSFSAIIDRLVSLEKNISFNQYFMKDQLEERKEKELDRYSMMLNRFELIEKNQLKKTQQDFNKTNELLNRFESFEKNQSYLLDMMKQQQQQRDFDFQKNSALVVRLEILENNQSAIHDKLDLIMEFQKEQNTVSEKLTNRLNELNKTIIMKFEAFSEYVGNLSDKVEENSLEFIHLESKLSNITNTQIFLVKQMNNLTKFSRDEISGILENQKLQNESIKSVRSKCNSLYLDLKNVLEIQQDDLRNNISVLFLDFETRLENNARELNDFKDEVSLSTSNLVATVANISEGQEELKNKSHMTEFYSRCPVGSYLYKNACILVQESPKRTWEESNKFCISNGGHLLDIGDQPTSSFLTMVPPIVKRYWINLCLNNGIWTWNLSKHIHNSDFINHTGCSYVDRQKNSARYFTSSDVDPLSTVCEIKPKY